MSKKRGVHFACHAARRSKSNQMSHVLNTTVKCFTYKPLTNNAVLRKYIKKARDKSNKSLKSSSKITIVRLYTGCTGTESMCYVIEV
jgi:hypothetical protein